MQPFTTRIEPTTLDDLRDRLDRTRRPPGPSSGNSRRPLPFMLRHGWPSTCAEFRHVIGPLTDAAAFGGDPADAFDVVML